MRDPTTMLCEEQHSACRNCVVTMAKGLDPEYVHHVRIFRCAMCREENELTDTSDWEEEVTDVLFPKDGETTNKPLKRHIESLPTRCCNESDDTKCDWKG